MGLKITVQEFFKTVLQEHDVTDDVKFDTFLKSNMEKFLIKKLLTLSC